MWKQSGFIGRSVCALLIVAWLSSAVVSADENLADKTAGQNVSAVTGAAIQRVNAVSGSAIQKTNAVTGSAVQKGNAEDAFLGR